ncbi:YczE/YyaS/YitT family protein [Bacillus sp. FJAT-45350]|uniref:YczE/YyaS/YitT family protein n=1 Tax=Bacillus sp. FJAT-45350 TaxID=2011014 RepID=UPI000BB8B408|nr:hypothetical protein [Bacillus sp. FJAT-45350]
MHISPRRFIFYVLGIFLLALGIALTIQSRLGTSPFDALLVGLYRTIGLTVGSWEVILALILIFFNAALLRNRPEFLALVTAIITGIGIDFWLFTLSGWVEPTTLIGQFIILLVGIVISGFGIAAYLQANFAPIPMDRLMLIIRDLTKLNLFYSRGIMNIGFVILAFLFNGPIGIGTILITFFSGAVINFFMPYVVKLEKKFVQEKEKRHAA